ncbi:MAG: transcriptional repressor, partial [Muribaculaceae bacterium]|nr:transcriptional repressor [Muribaculaceae bacterium]
TIEQLNDEMEKESYHVSRATVYNTVELLIAAGILRKLFLDGVQMKYERITKVSYTYLVCSSCGKIKEVKDYDLSAYMNARTYNAFHSDHFSMCVYGVCNSCARKQKKRNTVNVKQKIQNRK